MFLLPMMIMMIKMTIKMMMVRWWWSVKLLTNYRPNKLWCGAQQTPPPAATYATNLLKPVLCCHLANDNYLLTPVVWAMAGDSKQLDFDPLTRLPELTQNWIRSSHGHSTPSLKISCKSVQPFSRNLADKETNKERNRSITIPRPPTGFGVKMFIVSVR